MTVTKNIRDEEQIMYSRRTSVVSALLTSLLLSSGCGGYTNDNVPEIVVTDEMMEEMNQQEAERQERYRKLAAEKGMQLAPVTTDGPPVGMSMQKRREAFEKRAARRKNN